MNFDLWWLVFIVNMEKVGFIVALDYIVDRCFSSSYNILCGIINLTH